MTWPLRILPIHKGKHHKYGIKIYSINELRGLALKFKVYAGGQDELAGKGHVLTVVN